MNIYLMLHFRNTLFFLRCFIDSCKSFSLHIEQILTQFLFYHVYRTVVRSENPGVPVLFDGHNLPTLVEIGLTDLPKSGGAMAPLGTTGLLTIIVLKTLHNNISTIFLFIA